MHILEDYLKPGLKKDEDDLEENRAWIVRSDEKSGLLASYAHGLLMRAGNIKYLVRNGTAQKRQSEFCIILIVFSLVTFWSPATLAQETRPLPVRKMNDHAHAPPMFRCNRVQSSGSD